MSKDKPSLDPKKMKTSEMLGLMANPEAIVERMEAMGVISMAIASQQNIINVQRKVHAMVMNLAAEIDRRIPIPNDGAAAAPSVGDVLYDAVMSARPPLRPVMSFVDADQNATLFERPQPVEGVEVPPPTKFPFMSVGVDPGAVEGSYSEVTVVETETPIEPSNDDTTKPLACSLQASTDTGSRPR